MRTVPLLIAMLSALSLAVDITGQGKDSKPATLRGRVLDDSGRPVGGSQVSIGWFIGPADKLQLLNLPLGTLTDTDGQYEISGVPPGDWYMEVRQVALLPGAVEAETPDYPPTFFPGVTEARLARPVHFEPGAAVANVNVVVPRIPVFELALRLSPLDRVTSPQLEIFFDATAARSPRAIPGRAVEPGGFLRFRRLRPGRYVVWVRAHSSSGMLAAWRSIEIEDRSIEIEFPLTPAGRISGRVVSEDIAALSGARVVAALVDGEREIDPRAPDSVEIAPDGRFVIEGLFGDRRLRIIGLPEGRELKSVRLDGRAIARPISVVGGESVDGLELIVGGSP